LSDWISIQNLKSKIQNGLGVGGLDLEAIDDQDIGVIR
jgi:hypothetical protein